MPLRDLASRIDFIPWQNGAGAVFPIRNTELTESMIQGSINALEYELSRAMRKLIAQERPRIALIQGHGELGRRKPRTS